MTRPHDPCILTCVNQPGADRSADDESTEVDAVEVTALLDRWREGDRGALDTLVPMLYRELRRLAGQRMHREGAEHTLQPTALVHEAWLRLADSAGGFRNRAHFFGAAALAMRGILVDHARRLRADKHGGDRERVPLDQVEVAIPGNDDKLLDSMALGEALEGLDGVAPMQCTVATMRFLFGCSVEETAEALGVSAGKVKKDWAFAKAWLQRELRRGGAGDE